MAADLTLAISLFPAPATVRTRPTRRDLAWAQLTELLSRHEVWADKDGRGWSPATYAPGTTRANKNVRASSAFVGDIDHASFQDLAALKERLVHLGFACVLYSTYGNAPPDDLRFRIVVPFTTPLVIKGSQAEGVRLWRRVWQAATHFLLGGRNDPQTKDMSRFFYLPSTPPGHLVLAEVHAGEPLDWQSLPLSSTAPDVSPEPRRTTAPPHRLGYPTLEFLALGAPVDTQRSRALAATRALLAAGKSVEETAQLVWHGLQISPCGDPDHPWTFAHALQLAQDLDGREASPLDPMITLRGTSAHHTDRSHPNVLRQRAERLAARFRARR